MDQQSLKCTMVCPFWVSYKSASQTESTIGTLSSLYRLAYPKKQLGHLPLPRSQEAYKVKEK